MRPAVWSVSELVRELNFLLEQGFSGIAVDGEVAGATVSGRGHLYFTLKDESAALDCVMWASRAERLRFRLEDGIAVRVVGALSVYGQRGRLQLVADAVEPLGLGALQLAFEQLKARLQSEGLFAVERKRALPVFPRRIGVVTSPTGAALRDILKVLRELPFAEVVLAATPVQGEGASERIAVAVDRLGTSGLVDVLIVARGGGSLDDLWAFNEEPVARAIAACAVPVVCGVGHEVDVTIADLVADLRAATPTHAAELVAERLESVVRRVADARVRLRRDLRRHLGLARSRLAGLEGSSGLARVPQRLRLARARLERARRLPGLLRHRLERARTGLDRVDGGLARLPARLAAGGHRRLLRSTVLLLERSMTGRVASTRGRVAAAERALGHLGPQAVLERGYSITTVGDDPRPLKDPRNAGPGSVLSTRLARGTVRSVVAAPRPPSRPRGSGRQGELFDVEEEG